MSDAARPFRPCLCHIDCILVSAAWKNPAPRLPERATEAGCALPWCGRWDSNPHGFLHQNLNLACLPFHHARMYIDSVSHAATKSTGKTDIRAKNTHPPRRPYRKADSRGDHKPSGEKRGEEDDEKPIGRIGKRGEEREPSLPVNREGNAGRQAREKFSPPIVKGTRGERRGRRVSPSRIGARHGKSNRVLRCGGAGKTVRKAGRLIAGYIAIG